MYILSSCENSDRSVKIHSMVDYIISVLIVDSEITRSYRCAYLHVLENGPLVVSGAHVGKCSVV